MRFLPILMFACCCGLLSAQKNDKTLEITSFKTTEGFLMPATERPMVLIKGNEVFPAKGYEIKYSTVNDVLWVQAEGSQFSSEQVLEAKKKKKKKKKKKGSKKKPQRLILTCLSMKPGCECYVVNVGTAEKPIYRCSAGCSCNMAATPGIMKSVATMMTADGNFTRDDFGFDL